MQAACRNGWKEGEEKLVRLPELSPYSFTVYLHWLYTGKIGFDDDDGDIEFDPPFKAEQEADLRPGDTVDDHGYYDFFCAYVIGDFLQDTSLANHAMTECVQLRSENDQIEGNPIPGPRQITWAWNNTPPQSRLRQWIVDAVATTTEPNMFSEHASKYPAECVQELAKAMLKYIRQTMNDCGDYPMLDEACQYHDHTDDPDACPYSADTKPLSAEDENTYADESESSSADSESSDEY